MNPVPHPPMELDDVEPATPRQIARRRFLGRGLSLGALTMLTGCDLSGHGPIDQVLWAMLRFNDRVQAALFNPHRLAATFPPSAITRPFRFNAYYPEYQVRTVDAASWKLELGGLIADKGPAPWRSFGRCRSTARSPGRSASRAGASSGKGAGSASPTFCVAWAPTGAPRYVGFKCFDDYSYSIDMASALHPQTILALDFDHKPLAPPWGAPLRLRLPTKLGFKNPKYLSALWVTNKYPGPYWADQGYNWFSGL